MNWAIVAILGYLLTAAGAGLQPAWSVGGLAPLPGLVLLAWVGLRSSAMGAMWTGLLLGALIDLSTVGPSGQTVLGPYALGGLAAAYSVLRTRAALLRSSIWTLSIMTVQAGIVAHLVMVSLLVLRRLPFLAGAEGGGYSAIGELFEGIGVALITGLLALPLGWALGRVAFPLGLAGSVRTDRR